MARRPTSGDLNERVQIQTSTATVGRFGEDLLAWATTATVWARIKSEKKGEGEPLLADRPAMVTRYQVVIRSGVTVTNQERLLRGSQILQVETVRPHEPERGYSTLICVEVVQ